MTQSLLVEPPPLLTAEQQYRLDLTTFPVLTKEQERILVERGRAGENVRDVMILALQLRIYRMAGKYTQKAPSVERLDLVQSATEKMLSCYEASLVKREPIAYLLQIARYTMSDAIRGRKDSIKTYRREHRVTLLSLDAEYVDPA